MKLIKYINYWDVNKKISTEKATVGKWDLWNGTKQKKKVENGELTSENVAIENHSKGFGYEFCSFDGHHAEYPYCYVTVVPKNKHIGVNFIDDAGRKYLTYLFHEVKEDRTLFLQEIWYYHFTSERGENEDYRLHFVFDEEGNVNYRKYDEKNQKIEDYESNRKFDISGLYEAYPAFGEYKSLIRLDRDLPLDIFPGDDHTDGNPDHPKNPWLSPDWNKN
ncbi:hypothetical protein OQX61_01670 [Pedobacter sp. PLR]|uniref:hypothetical protein n=1 Tax=Pedobacter sp. PLR TaxID=2994465 RepID=UPI0022477D6F|nr:hypothetical protein [Pedobacter sp. PLR]MCX2449967.1 hypothetical protein [Pedobacter sp. PLR]